MLSEIERFVNWVRRRNPQARTWKDYGYDLRQFAQVVGARPPVEITFRDVDNFVNQQTERGYQPCTINRRLAAILSFYVFLGEEDAGLVCPVIPRRHFLREPQRLPRPVPEENLEQFFAAIPANAEGVRDRAMFTIMLRCGLRIGEVAAIRLADLYLDEPKARLLVRGKGSRERSVYLSPQAKHNVQAYLAQRPATASDFLFLSYQLDGLSTTGIHKRLMIYRSAAHVTLTAHRLRHSFANDLVNADTPVTTIQKLLGHRWLETTQIYVQANDRQVCEDYFAASEKLEGWA